MDVLKFIGTSFTKYGGIWFSLYATLTVVVSLAFRYFGDAPLEGASFKGMLVVVAGIVGLVKLIYGAATRHQRSDAKGTAPR
jgi:hypothetical protein